MITLPLAIAGVASVISPSEFRPSSLNSWPACITNVSPSSLIAKIFPLYDHGDAENVPASDGDALAAVDLLAGLRIVRREEPAIHQRVVLIADDERRRIAGGQRRMRPGDERVAALLALQADVARRAGPDRIRRPPRIREIAGAHEQQSVAGDRRHRVNGRHAAQLPQQLPVRVVRTHALRCRSSRSRCRRSFCHTNGVDQFDPSPSRSARHNSSPLFASNAATNDRSSLSLTM